MTIGSLTVPAVAQESSFSKSITSGWKSVVKETSKAAKSVTKAANDALSPKKAKKKKAAKPKPDADHAAAEADEAGEAKPDASDKASPRAAKTKRGADGKAAAQADTPTARRLDVDEGPPVPLVKEPSDAHKPPVPTQAAVPPIREPGARRLPPPPPTPVAQPVERDSSDWSASTIEDAAERVPEVKVVPSKAGEKPAAPTAKPLPITMIPAKAAEGTAPVAETWTKEEIDAAKANCDAVLKGVDAVTTPEAPVREGSCGAPAPVRLVSIGKNPEVKLMPQPLVTCELVAGLYQWMKTDIQPLAKKHLGGPITKIETMSDYSCRMAYGRKGNKLSEHGKANALDIRGFVTAKGQTAYVLEQWGKTERDRAAEAAKLAAERTAAAQAAEAAAAAGSKSAVAEAKGVSPTGRPAPALAGLGATSVSVAAPPLKPSLHNTADKAAAVIVPEAPDSPKSQFLRDAHTSACRIFGTSLGPESNEAHRNHFHVDMAARKRTKICE
jgi:hypothetical protein